MAHTLNSLQGLHLSQYQLAVALISTSGIKLNWPSVQWMVEST